MISSLALGRSPYYLGMHRAKSKFRWALRFDPHESPSAMQSPLMALAFCYGVSRVKECTSHLAEQQLSTALGTAHLCTLQGTYFSTVLAVKAHCLPLCNRGATVLALSWVALATCMDPSTQMSWHPRLSELPLASLAILVPPVDLLEESPPRRPPPAALVQTTSKMSKTGCDSSTSTVSHNRPRPLLVRDGKPLPVLEYFFSVRLARTRLHTHDIGATPIRRRHRFFTASVASHHSPIAAARRPSETPLKRPVASSFFSMCSLRYLAKTASGPSRRWSGRAEDCGPQRNEPMLPSINYNLHSISGSFDYVFLILLPAIIGGFFVLCISR